MEDRSLCCHRVHEEDRQEDEQGDQEGVLER